MNHSRLRDAIHYMLNCFTGNISRNQLEESATGSRPSRCQYRFLTLWLLTTAREGLWDRVIRVNFHKAHNGTFTSSASFIVTIMIYGIFTALCSGAMSALSQNYFHRVGDDPATRTTVQAPPRDRPARHPASFVHAPPPPPPPLHTATAIATRCAFRGPRAQHGVHLQDIESHGDWYVPAEWILPDLVTDQVPARELTLDAAQAARMPPRTSSKPLDRNQIRKLLDSRNEREVMDGLRRVVSVRAHLIDA